MRLRHREMEDALGGPVDRSITVEKVRQIAQEFTDESEFVDLKSKGTMLGKRKNRDLWRLEMGKDIAAFANARGGVLIFGVEDAKSAGPCERLKPFTPDEVDPGELIEDTRKAIREVTAPLPDYDIFQVRDPDDETFYVVCVVPPSASAPHAVRQPGDGRNGLFYPSRAPGESHAQFLVEFQVAELYERRARVGEDRRKRAETVWADGIDALDAPRAPRVWLAVASVPDLARDDVLTAEARREIEEWEDSADTFPTLIQKGFSGVGGYPVPAPGRMCLTQAVSDQEGTRALISVVSGFYCEIHADGSAFAALPLSELDGTSPFTIATDELVDTVATATAHAVAWTGARTGLWGATTVTAGIVVNGTDDTVLKIDGYGGFDSRRIIHRPVERRWPRAVTSVDLADTSSMQERLAVAFRLATSLVQAFGVPGLGWLTEEGALRPYRMNNDRVGTAREWANRHHVRLDNN
ncbi:helix-turn-helix domain-containing protein [Mycolicibacterium fortuitum]|uniref:AlbA family DNA-binding domain-containing protein n=1 Tax=Mycolicibacterium fortuitum TaxID=1766 RepID=UPI000AD3D8CF|nr:ATP-binding protein [Mycolicibacterium fortuitum]